MCQMPVLPYDCRVAPTSVTWDTVVRWVSDAMMNLVVDKEDPKNVWLKGFCTFVYEQHWLGIAGNAA